MHYTQQYLGKHLQFNQKVSAIWLSSVRKSFQSVHFTSFNWLQINQKVFANSTLTRSQSESIWPAHCSLISCREATKAERVLGNGAFEEQSALVNINGGRCIFVRITQILIHFNTNTEANTTTNTLARVAGEQSGAVKIIGAASLSRQCTPFTWICEQVGRFLFYFF